MRKRSQDPATPDQLHAGLKPVQTESLWPIPYILRETPPAWRCLTKLRCEDREPTKTYVGLRSAPPLECGTSHWRSKMWGELDCVSLHCSCQESGFREVRRHCSGEVGQHSLRWKRPKLGFPDSWGFQLALVYGREDLGMKNQGSMGTQQGWDNWGPLG